MTYTIQNDNIPNQIVPSVLKKLREYLDEVMILDVPESNPTRAILVKIGRFQENPIQKNVSVSISSGDFEDPRYMDARIDHPDMEEDFPLRNLPVGEIGGGHYWWRRGSINFQCFFVRQRYPEDVAMQYAYDFYGRLLKAVEDFRMGNLRDDYGEGNVMAELILEAASFFEAGGKDKFIWRGKLLWRYLTWRP